MVLFCGIFRIPTNTGFVVPGAKAYGGPCLLLLMRQTIFYQASLIVYLSAMKLLDVQQPSFKEVYPVIVMLLGQLLTCQLSRYNVLSTVTDSRP
jgi:hypothetical protein